MTDKELQYFSEKVVNVILSNTDNPTKYHEKYGFIVAQTACNICNGSLKIKTEQINKNTVKEEARCSKCSALQRIQDHSLQ